MNIDPLESILKIYKDKNKVFEEYLDDETLEKLNNKIYKDIKETLNLLKNI